MKTYIVTTGVISGSGTPRKQEVTAAVAEIDAGHLVFKNDEGEMVAAFSPGNWLGYVEKK